MKHHGQMGLLPRPSKSRYRQQFGVIIICRNEADQAKVYQRTLKRAGGREIKVVVT